MVCPIDKTAGVNLPSPMRIRIWEFWEDELPTRHVWSAAVLQAKNEEDRIGLRTCIGERKTPSQICSESGLFTGISVAP